MQPSGTVGFPSVANAPVSKQNQSLALSVHPFFVLQYSSTWSLKQNYCCDGCTQAPFLYLNLVVVVVVAVAVAVVVVVVANAEKWNFLTASDRDRKEELLDAV
jgi:hypothetical protein